jgi:methylase of polypeptide subunit release factors
MPRNALWMGESGDAPPTNIVEIDDTWRANEAYKLAMQGAHLLWRGDFHNARQLLAALDQRIGPPQGARDASGRSGARGSGRYSAQGNSAQSSSANLSAFGSSLKAARAASVSAAQPSPAQAYAAHRALQAKRARVLGKLLVPITADGRVPLRRAPDFQEVLAFAWKTPFEGRFGAVNSNSQDTVSPTSSADGDVAQVSGSSEPSTWALAPLRMLLGMNGAHQWFLKGVPVAALGASVHPHYGVFAPVRQDYVDLLAQTLAARIRTWPAARLAQAAFDIGTGTGILAALMARAGLRDVVATDTDPNAIACAKDNLHRLGLLEAEQHAAHQTVPPSRQALEQSSEQQSGQHSAQQSANVSVRECALFPPGEASLIVCNPPWLPGDAHSTMEAAIFDPESRMLRGFLSGVRAHLAPGGEAWLVMSDFAERVGLRPQDALAAWIEEAKLEVIEQHTTQPRHKKSQEASDPLHAARVGEVVSLWRLGTACP